MDAVLIHPLHSSYSVRSLCKLCGWEAELEDVCKNSIVAESNNTKSTLKKFTRVLRSVLKTISSQII